MSRSKWKGVFVNNNFLNLFLQVKNNELKSVDDKIKLFDYKGNLRDSTIISSFIGYEFLVFNGRKYNSVIVDLNMVGFKFGSFSLVNVFANYMGFDMMVHRKFLRKQRKEKEKKERKERRVKRMLDKDD